MNSLHRPRPRKLAAQRDPEAVIRTFLRVLEKLAPRPHGGRKPNAAPARKNPDLRAARRGMNQRA